MFDSQSTHLLSWGAQLPDAILNLLPEAEHSLELLLQEITLLGGIHSVLLSHRPQGWPEPDPALQHSLHAREWKTYSYLGGFPSSQETLDLLAHGARVGVLLPGNGQQADIPI